MKKDNAGKPKEKKRLRAQVCVGHDLDGNPIYKWASAATKRELAEKKDELKRAYIGGVKVQRDIMFGEYAKKWYEIYKKPNIAESSQVNYRSAMNGKILPAFGDRQMKAITAMELQAFINRYAGMGSTTLTYLMAVLTNTFKTACAQGIIDRDPAAALIKPKTSEESKRELTDAETEATLSLIATHRDGLLLALLYYTGVRRGEALGLRWTDVNFSDKTIHIERDVDFVTGDIGPCKSEYSVRDVPIPNALLQILKESRGIGYIMTSKRGRFWCQSTYVRRWKQLQADMVSLSPEIEQEEGKSILTAHYFRHNYATLLYDAGVDVLTAQQYLGHSDPATTLRIYTHLGKRKKKLGAKKVNRAFS